MGIQPAHQGSDIDHREECAGTDYIPHPAAEKTVAKYHGYNDKKCVDYDLCFRKRHTSHLGDGDRDSLARHRNRAASDFKSNTQPENRTTGELSHDFSKQTVDNGNRRQNHVQVKEITEKKAYHKLEQLHRLKPPVQQDYL